MGKSWRRLLMLFLLGMLSKPSDCLAQTFRIGNVRSLKATAFDRDSKTIYAIWKDSIRAFYPPDYTSTRLIPVTPPELYFPEGFAALCVDSSLYFVHISGGIVYKLEKDSLVRIDRSFDHKMQINSTIFARNDTIFRYGGYGFWSDRNFFTYFSQETREWEILPPKGSKQLPRGGQNTRVAQDEGHIYIFSGISTSKFNPLVFEDFRELWRFDMNTYGWEHLGNLTQDFHKYIKVLHLGDKILLGSPTQTQWVLVDPAKNELAYYDIDAAKKNVYSRTSNFLYGINSFYDDGKIYLVQSNHPNRSVAWDGELVCTIVDEEYLLGDPVNSERMYSTDSLPMKMAGGIAGAAGVLLLAFYGRKKYKERNLLKVSNKEVRYKGRKIPMDPAQLKVLNLLLRTSGEVPTSEILDLVENPQQSPAHNFRVKNQVIENLNFQLKTILSLEEDPIQSKKSDEDKRIKSYLIQSRYFLVK